MIVLTKKQMQQVDKLSIEKYFIPGIVLMENAALNSTNVILNIIPEFKKYNYHIFTYKGNNSGDGFAIARHLYNRGCNVFVYLWEDNPDNFRGETKVNFDIIMSLNGIKKIVKPEIDKLNFGVNDIIIDAIFGIGFQGKLRAPFYDLINKLNSQNVYKRIAIDIPSGLDADRGVVEEPIFRADFTVTMAFPKIGMIFHPSELYTGDIFVVDISIPEEVLSDVDIYMYSLEDDEIFFPERKDYFHKGNYGKVSIIAGNHGMFGAGLLASSSTLRSGAGLVKWYTLKDAANVSFSSHPQIMTIGLESFLDIYREWENITKWSDVLVAGPGFGRDNIVRDVLKFILENWNGKLILDADAIYNLNLEWLKDRCNEMTIITPHPGEFSKLTGMGIAEILKNPVEIVRKISLEYKINILLKVMPSFIVDYNGNVYLNSSGDDSLATAGSGDVLTGIIAGITAQNFDLVESAKTAMYIHGIAGEIAGEKLSKYSVTSKDLIDFLPEVFNFFTKKEI